MNGPLFVLNPNRRSSSLLLVGSSTPSSHGLHVSGFLDHAAALSLKDRDGRIVSRRSAIDHEAAWSVYFQDPWGHDLEVTTYDHQAVRVALSAH